MSLSCGRMWHNIFLYHCQHTSHLSLLLEMHCCSFYKRNKILLWICKEDNTLHYFPIKKDKLFPNNRSKLCTWITAQWSSCDWVFRSRVTKLHHGLVQIMGELLWKALNHTETDEQRRFQGKCDAQLHSQQQSVDLCFEPVSHLQWCFVWDN